MSQNALTSDNGLAEGRVAEFHLLGVVDFEACLQLQRRLVYEVSRDRNGKIVVLLCEHPELITIGRHGSRSHVRINAEDLRRGQISVRWVKRGGGAVLHGPGQLAVYVIAHLPTQAWTVGSYLSRLRDGIAASTETLGMRPQLRPSSFGVWGRTGLLAAAGVAVQHGTTSHGVFVNVNPAMGRYGFVDSAAEANNGGRTTMSCLLAERRQALRMTSVRSTLVQQLASSFDCQQHYIHSGHRWLRSGISGEHVARAS